VKKNVKYPTDLNLLLDSVRVVIRESSRLADSLELGGWRKSVYLFSKLKNHYLILTRMRRSSSKNEEKQEKKLREIEAKCRTYLSRCELIFSKAEQTIFESGASKNALSHLSSVNEINCFIQSGRYHINLIERRLLKDEKIPHEEKIFSLFEPETEWIKKGKAGVQQELGLNVCIATDQYGFILHHQVMRKVKDVHITISFTDAILKNYALNSISFEKGFYSKTNNEEVSNGEKNRIIHKKGKGNYQETEREYSPEFMKRRRAHSAIESSINGLNHGGLKRCPDKYSIGFDRYIALGIVARNLKNLGALLQKKEILLAG